MIKDVAQINNVKKLRIIEVGEGEPFFTTYFYTAEGKKFLYSVDEIKFKDINTIVWDAGEEIMFGKTASCKIQENVEENFRVATCSESQ